LFGWVVDSAFNKTQRRGVRRAAAAAWRRGAAALDHVFAVLQLRLLSPYVSCGVSSGWRRAPAAHGCLSAVYALHLCLWDARRCWVASFTRCSRAGRCSAAPTLRAVRRAALIHRSRAHAFALPYAIAAPAWFLWFSPRLAPAAAALLWFRRLDAGDGGALVRALLYPPLSSRLPTAPAYRVAPACVPFAASTGRYS